MSQDSPVKKRRRGAGIALPASESVIVTIEAGGSGVTAALIRIRELAKEMFAGFAEVYTAGEIASAANYKTPGGAGVRGREPAERPAPHGG